MLNGEAEILDDAVVVGRLDKDPLHEAFTSSATPDPRTISGRGLVSQEQQSLILTIGILRWRLAQEQEGGEMWRLHDA